MITTLVYPAIVTGLDTWGSYCHQTRGSCHLAHHVTHLTRIHDTITPCHADQSPSSPGINIFSDPVTTRNHPRPRSSDLRAVRDGCVRYGLLLGLHPPLPQGCQLLPHVRLLGLEIQTDNCNKDGRRWFEVKDFGNYPEL